MKRMLLVVTLVLAAGCYTAEEATTGIPIKADLVEHGCDPAYAFTVYPYLRGVVEDCLWRDGHTLPLAPGERGHGPLWNPSADDSYVRDTLRNMPPEWIGRARKALLKGGE